MCPFFLCISFSFTFAFDISGSIFLHHFFVNPQKLYRVTVAEHTPYQVSAMYKAIAVLMQSPELGKNKLTPCPIIHLFLLFDVIHVSAKGLMANFKYKENQHNCLGLGCFFSKSLVFIKVAFQQIIS